MIIFFLTVNNDLKLFLNNVTNINKINVIVYCEESYNFFIINLYLQGKY